MKQIIEALTHSNYIENEFSVRALADVLDCWDNWSKPSGMYSLQGEFGITMIKSIHRSLMKNIDPDIAGKFRNYNVHVGNFIAPDYKEVFELMDDWVKEFGAKDTWAGINLAHIAFEKIHPFADGNGRGGRMIMYLQQLWAYEEIRPILIEDGQEYYKWFR